MGGVLPIRARASIHVTPLKRHTHTYRGIATYYARPLIVPTQEAYSYLQGPGILASPLLAPRCLLHGGPLITPLQLL